MLPFAFRFPLRWTPCKSQRRCRIKSVLSSSEASLSWDSPSASGCAPENSPNSLKMRLHIPRTQFNLLEQHLESVQVRWSIQLSVSRKDAKHIPLSLNGYLTSSRSNADRKILNTRVKCIPQRHLVNIFLGNPFKHLIPTCFYEILWLQIQKFKLQKQKHRWRNTLNMSHKILIKQLHLCWFLPLCGHFTPSTRMWLVCRAGWIIKSSKTF